MEKKNNIKRKIGIAFLGVFILIASFFVAVVARYFADISTKKVGQDTQIIVNSGEGVDAISEKLKSFGWIDSKNSFKIYSKISKKTNFKAGVYKFEGEKTIPEIVDILNSGQIQKTFAVTFLPGGTIASAKKSLKSAGFSDAEIEAAFKKDYSKDFPLLFEDKPAKADLEGYFYGETHIFEKGVAAESVLSRFFGDFEKKFEEFGLKNKFKSRGLNVYEGLTLASIVQRESIGCGAKNICEDQRQIAGVFFNRLNKNMNLGSDVTYQYIADKTGVERDVNLKSPYNLRINTGLTPTPISTPSISALNAVAEPAEHDYLFFLSGDDDRTYFGKSSEEHEKNIKEHCKEKCQII